MDGVRDLTNLKASITFPNIRRLYARNIVSASCEGNDHSYMYAWPGPFPNLEKQRDSSSGLGHLELF